MTKIRVGLNGFGRIGRYVTRLCINHPTIELVAINDKAPIETLVHLLKYDSVHGKLPFNCQIKGDTLLVNSKEIKFTQFSSPSEIPWKELDVDFVIESTGLFLSKEFAEMHIQAGAKKVILSAPSISEEIPTIVLGVNEKQLTKNDLIVSNASCTTNSAAPLIKVLKGICSIESAYITTVHSYTTDQRLHDSPHKDLRRARAAAQSIVPTTTGAAKAITRIFPDLKDHIGGCGMRVPVPDGSLTDITLIVKDEITVEEINSAFEKAANNELKGILEYTNDPIVSVDVLGNSHSSLFDSELTSVVGRMVKVVAWYDNEAGYSNRLVNLIEYMDQL
jgi:glyceraldehyde 3-phosphate dehydrogenase